MHDTDSYHIFMSANCFPQTPQYHICPFFVYMTWSALLDTQCGNSCGEGSLSRLETMNSLCFGLYSYFFLQLMTVKMFLSKLDLSPHISQKNAFLNMQTLHGKMPRQGFLLQLRCKRTISTSLTSICLTVN